jgi:hypothetical protein
MTPEHPTVALARRFVNAVENGYPLQPEEMDHFSIAQHLLLLQAVADALVELLAADNVEALDDKEDFEHWAAFKRKVAAVQAGYAAIRALDGAPGQGG